MQRSPSVPVLKFRPSSRATDLAAGGRPVAVRLPWPGVPQLREQQGGDDRARHLAHRPDD